MQRPILPIDFWKTLKPAGRSPAGARKAIPGRLHLLVPQLEIHQHAASIHYRRTAGGGLGTAILGSMTKPLHEKLMQGRFVFH